MFPPMRPTRPYRSALRARFPGLAVVFGVFLTGCAGGSGGSTEPTAREVTRGLDRSDRYVDRTVEGASNDPSVGALALLDGQPIEASDISVGLVEAAGATVLQEHILDSLLRRELARVNRTIDPEQIDAELAILIDSLTAGGVASDSDEARALLDQLRRNRSLGDSRFQALLWRNAAMRALVAPRVNVTNQDLELAYQLRYAETYSARLITTDTASQATQAIRRVRDGEPFGEVAAALSTDISRDRGGLLPPISPADPTFPAAVRTTLAQLSPGEVSQPVALASTYAILKLERINPADPSAPPSAQAARDVLEPDVRLQKERAEMDLLARTLLESARVQILDPQLQREWIRRLGG